MARKVIIDTDPGIDDAVALCLALFDPRLDVVAVTAVGGNIGPEQATRNVQTVIEQLDPPRWPRIGKACETEYGLPADSRHLFGADGLGEAGFPFVELQHLHAADRVLVDETRASPDEVTLLAIGPLTNLAAAFRRDPALSNMVGQIVIMGGTLTCQGNATPAAEFNFYCDPTAARAILKTPATKTLIPLEITSQVVFSFDFLDQLPDQFSRAGRFLQKILPFAYRTYRERLGLEGIRLHDAVAAAFVSHPELFTTEAMACDVETAGELTMGATIFDRRARREWRRNVEVVTAVKVDEVREMIRQGLLAAGDAG